MTLSPPPEPGPPSRPRVRLIDAVLWCLILVVYVFVLTRGVLP